MGLVHPIFQTERREAIKLFQMLINSKSKQASDNLNDIIDAILNGRVKVLFPGLDKQIWGSFDLNRNMIEVHKDSQPGDMGLLDMTFAQTFLKNGTVYILNPDETDEMFALVQFFVTRNNNEV